MEITPINTNFAIANYYLKVTLSVNSQADGRECEKKKDLQFVNKRGIRVSLYILILSSVMNLKVLLEDFKVNNCLIILH